MKIVIWGSRGSVPVPGEKTVKYGGNTTAVQVILENKANILIDAGTGIRLLGNKLTKGPYEAALLFTHFHLDHLIGFPFFKPFYMADKKFVIIGPKENAKSLRDTIDGILARDYFPVDTSYFKAKLEFIAIGEEKFDLFGAKVESIYLNHPTQTLGYKITEHNKCFAYLTDTEPYWGFIHEVYKGFRRHNDPMKLEESLDEFVQNCDLLIHDGQYTLEEYKKGKITWGHYPMEEVVKRAIRANVKKVLITHHDPDRSDDELEKIERQLQEYARKAGYTGVVAMAKEMDSYEL